MTFFSDVMIEGSSPRVRGKHSSADAGPGGRGLIPARAGKTRAMPSARSHVGAHPRACGENPRPWSPRLWTFGSSPRVRGKPHMSKRDSAARRLIPARAGKTGGADGEGDGEGAHPRACGENRSMSRVACSMLGSSPRVRGKPKRPGAKRGALRLIPARAGKTRGLPRDRRASAAHPRACGENLMNHQSRGSHPGSSPRVRGKQDPYFGARQAQRLIPARAGKTGSSSRAGAR